MSVSFPKPARRRSGGVSLDDNRREAGGDSGSGTRGERADRPRKHDRGGGRDVDPARQRPSGHTDRQRPSDRSDRQRPSDRSDRHRPSDRSNRQRPSDRSDRPDWQRPSGWSMRQSPPSRSDRQRPERDEALTALEYTAAADLPAGSAASSLPGGQTAEGQAPLLPGSKPVLELLLESPERVDVVFLRKGRHSRDMERIADLCREAGVRFSLLDPAAFGRLYAGHSQGVLARLYEAGYTEFSTLLDGIMDAPLPLIVVLDQVQDPGNAGTLARTLYAMGGAGLVVPRHNGVYLGAAAGKAAAGALERLPVSRVANLGHALDEARERGITIYGASAEPRQGTAAAQRQAQNNEAAQRQAQDNEAAQSRPEGGKGHASPPLSRDVFDAPLHLPAVLVLGGEESGIRPGTEKRCDVLLRIPLLRDFDSLNVAQAGGILVSCFARALLRKQ